MKAAAAHARPVASAQPQPATRAQGGAGLALNPVWLAMALEVQGNRLPVGSPDEPLEREADRAADQVVDGMGGARIVPRSALGPSIQRACAECEEEEPQRSADAGATADAAPAAVASDIAAMRGAGEPLPQALRDVMEARFGSDFSGVRIHRGARAAGAARGLGAKAFTLGQDIAFAQGQFDPGRRSGLHLLAHELTHTLQQEASPHGLVQRALDPANEWAWSWFARQYRRRDWSALFSETLSASAGAALELTETLSAQGVPADAAERETWREGFEPQLETLVRLNALGLMASHKATIEGRRDELLHPAVDAGGTTRPNPATQLRSAARLLNQLNSAKDYLEWSKVYLNGVGSEARTGLCWTMSGCVDDWVQTLYDNIQRYRPEQMREYWNERLRTLMAGVPSDLQRVFFSIFADTLVAWRARQIAGARMAIARVYDQFPLFKTLDPQSVEHDSEYAADTALMNAAAGAYVELLDDVDEAIVEIGSGDIHPFDLPEAVRLTRDSLPEAIRTEMNAVVSHHELVEFWTTMGLTFAQVLVVFIPVVGPALALGMGAVTTAVDIESLLDRVNLAEASTSPEGDILGVAAPGPLDYLMAGLEVVLTAADLGMMLSELRAARPLAAEGEALAGAEHEAAAAGGAEPERLGAAEEPEGLGRGTLEEPAGEPHGGAAEEPGASLERSVHDEAHRGGGEVEFGDGAHGVGAAGTGEMRGFYFCSDHCALLADKLDALLEALPENFPNREALAELRTRARAQSELLQRGALSAAEAEEAAASLASDLRRLVAGDGNVERMLSAAPEDLRAHAGAIRDEMARTLAATEAELRGGEGGALPHEMLDSVAELEGASRLARSEATLTSLEVAREAGIPAELTADGTVFTRADFPELVPEAPPVTGRPAPERIVPEGGFVEGGRPVGLSEIQNIEVRADAQLLLDAGADPNSLRVNQMQVIEDMRIGTNRPDLYAELNGRRIHIEYDRAGGERALGHARRILMNDPDAIVILKTIDF